MRVVFVFSSCLTTNAVATTYSEMNAYFAKKGFQFLQKSVDPSHISALSLEESIHSHFTPGLKCCQAVQGPWNSCKLKVNSGYSYVNESN